MILDYLGYLGLCIFCCAISQLLELPSLCLSHEKLFVCCSAFGDTKEFFPFIKYLKLDSKLCLALE